jgi:hypothetical protein
MSDWETGTKTENYEEEDNVQGKGLGHWIKEGRKSR